MPQFSDLPTKAFLGSTGAAANSYVLINYEDATTNAPVTYKASLQELGKAIVNDQQLYKKTQNGAVTTSVSNNAYVNSTVTQLVTASEKTMLDKMNYYVTANSQPHITIQGTSALNSYELITNGEYFDQNNNSGHPVVYDTVGSTLKYINDSNVLQPVFLSNDTTFDPTSYTNDDDAKLVFINDMGQLAQYDDGYISTLNLNDVFGSDGISALVYDNNNNEIKYLNEYNTPTSISHVPFDLGTYTDPQLLGGLLTFYDPATSEFYVYGSEGFTSLATVNPTKKITCLTSSDHGETQTSGTFALVCCDNSGNLYAMTGSDHFIEPIQV